MRVGLVSDTHDVFDPKLEGLFRGCALILHAGDITRQPILDALSAIAPVRAVRGNNDFGPLAEDLPETALVPLGGITALLVHEVHPARPSPAVLRALSRSGARLVVHGHSHRGAASLHDGVLFVNPGSAGPRRFSLPRTAGLLTVRDRVARVALFDLAGPAPVAFGEPVRVRL